MLLLASLLMLTVILQTVIYLSLGLDFISYSFTTMKKQIVKRGKYMCEYILHVEDTSAMNSQVQSTHVVKFRYLIF